MRASRQTAIRTLVATACAAALLNALPASGQDAAPAEEAPPAAAMPAPEEAPAASAIPKPAAEKKQPKKAAKKKISCDGLFEAACKEAGEKCAWSAGVAGADGSPAKGACITVDKSAAKGTKDTCPTMFQALCQETKGCSWDAGEPGADGKPAVGACKFGKAKKPAVKKKAAAAAPVEPARDAFTDQQAQ